jgi:hypothetical protein
MILVGQLSVSAIIAATKASNYKIGPLVGAYTCADSLGIELRKLEDARQAIICYNGKR